MGGWGVVGVVAPSKARITEVAEGAAPGVDEAGQGGEGSHEVAPTSTLPTEKFVLPEWAKSVFKHTNGKQMPCLNKKWRNDLPAEFAEAALARLHQGLCVKKFAEEETVHYHSSNGIVVATHNGIVLLACANYQCRLTSFSAKGMQRVNKHSEYTPDENGGMGSFTFKYDPTCITWLLLTKEIFESVKAKHTKNNKD